LILKKKSHGSFTGTGYCTNFMSQFKCAQKHEKFIQLIYCRELGWQRGGVG